MRLKGISDKGFDRLAKNAQGASSEEVDQFLANKNSSDARVYVGTYGKYNSGSIEGAWLELDDYDSVEEFYDAARELHKDEEDPEFMFQDHEGIPEGMVSESFISPDFFEYQRATSDWDEDTRDAFETFMEYMWSGNEGDMSEIIEAFESSYQGEFKDVGDYAYQLVEDIGGPEHINNPEFYFDYEQFERDLGIDGYYEEDGVVYGPEEGEETGYSTMEEMIDSWMEEGIISGETMANYFDFDKLGRDMDLGGDISFINGYVFNSNW